MRPGLLQNPIILLLVTGTLIGFNFPLGKIAGDANVSPMIWAMVVSLGASMMLLPVLAAKRRLTIPKGRMVRYIVVSALISFVIPNLLLFSVIPHTGAGYTGLMFALSPVFTLALALVFRINGPSRAGVCGITIGLIGVTVVSITRGGTPEAPAVIWILAALLIPLMLACGNIYRSLDWPEGASPDVLAFWSHAFSVSVFLMLLGFTKGSFQLNELALAPVAAVAQAVVAGITFPVFFRLQQNGGPVLLSQIGYVAAAVGLMAATFFLGERYGHMTWIGAAIIALGVSVTIFAQIAEHRKNANRALGTDFIGVRHSQPRMGR